MNRKRLVRGIQLIVAITLLSFSVVVYRDVHSHAASLEKGLAHVQPLWLLLAAVLALQEGVCGGLRMFVLGRVLSKELRVRTAITSEFVLMFCAGVTPGQAGAAPSQVAVLVQGGMRAVDVATASLMTAACTIIFFLATALTIFILRASGHLVASAGVGVDYLLGLSVTVFGVGLIALVFCAAYPPLLKTVIRGLAVPFGALARGVLLLLAKINKTAKWANAQLAKPGELRKKLIAGIDDIHKGFLVYLERGKLAYLGAQLLTFGFFCSRFAVAYFILLGLGVSTTPSSFVTIGPPIVQVVLVQALLNFALYLSPTPGASGIAEAGSNTLMAPWVSGPFELPYLVLWRFLALFLCMFVGGIYVFRYLGTDVMEGGAKNEAAKDGAKTDSPKEEGSSNGEKPKESR